MGGASKIRLQHIKRGFFCLLCLKVKSKKKKFLAKEKLSCMTGTAEFTFVSVNFELQLKQLSSAKSLHCGTVGHESRPSEV